MARRQLVVLCASLALGCDAVPGLYVIDASTDGVASSADAGADGAEESLEAAPPVCTGVSCPSCPPNPGACCASGVACLGSNCDVDCAAGCLACAGQVCCSKQGGQPVCRGDGGKCPP